MNDDQRNAFDALYRACYPEVSRRIFALVGDREQAEELAQEVFLKAWRAWPPTTHSHSHEQAQEYEPELLAGWLMTIARRTAIDALRAGACRPVCQSIEALGGERAEALFSSPIDEEETTLARMTFLAAWQQLPVRERLLVGCRASGVSLKQLAQEQGCSKGNISRRLVRARTILRHFYQKEHSA
jgi:RNA polymerase sigma-70 factor, ECF subfamily